MEPSFHLDRPGKHKVTMYVLYCTIYMTGLPFPVVISLQSNDIISGGATECVYVYYN